MLSFFEKVKISTTVDRKIKIYCAGPLFNNKEKEEMSEIANVLENNGYEVFLPHRDGFEFANLLGVLKNKGLSENGAHLLLNKAIFILDVYQVIDSDGLVLNINGRVPDEGATVEAGIAWNSGKEVVIYKNDSRSLLEGNDNPLLLGLSGFKVISQISAVPDAFRKIKSIDNEKNVKIDNKRLRDLYDKGKSVSFLAKNGVNKDQLCEEIINLLGGDVDD